MRVDASQCMMFDDVWKLAVEKTEVFVVECLILFRCGRTPKATSMDYIWLFVPVQLEYFCL